MCQSTDLRAEKRLWSEALELTRVGLDVQDVHWDHQVFLGTAKIKTKPQSCRRSRNAPLSHDDTIICY